MRSILEITGTAGENADTESITALLKNAGIANIKILTQPCFDDWLASLPKENMPGLGSECRGWIHSWGNGGGDCSTETCITSAIDDMESEVPAELAQAIYCSVADYSKSNFEAASLTMEMLNECIESLNIEDDDIDDDDIDDDCV